MTEAGRRLSAADWTDAALAAMAETGTAGVNVEQLARRLDTTKGSFYHHFENRNALLEAALERWEDLVVRDLRAADEVVDPRERLISFASVAAGSDLDGFVDLALGASMNDETVATALKRVNSRRLDYLDSTLQLLGVPPGVSRERAVGGLAAYLGLYQVQLMTGQRFEDDRLRALIGHAVEAMLSG